MLKLMSYVAVPLYKDGVAINHLTLSTKALVNNHVPDWETLARIEFKMIEYNTSFFTNGEVWTGLKTLIQKFLQSTSPTWKTSLVQLLERVKQLSTNLKQSTP